MHKTIAFGLFLFAIGCCVAHVSCKSAAAPLVQNVENAAAVAQYEALLDDCREQGRDAGSYAVYEACADAVDRDLCTRHGLRCKGDE